MHIMKKGGGMEERDALRIRGRSLGWRCEDCMKRGGGGRGKEAGEDRGGGRMEGGEGAREELGGKRDGGWLFMISMIIFDKQASKPNHSKQKMGGLADIYIFYIIKPTLFNTYYWKLSVIHFSFHSLSFLNFFNPSVSLLLPDPHPTLQLPFHDSRAEFLAFHSFYPSLPSLG